MENHQQSENYSSFDTQGLVKAGVVTALYVVMTMLVAPVAYGPIQFRISEALNYIGLYNKRYVPAITLGVVIVNFLQSTILDVVVGGLHTFLSLVLSRYLGDLAVKAYGHKVKDPMKLRYIVMALVFTATMFMIAWMLIYLGYENYFWQTYAILALSQLIVMTLGGLIMYFVVSKRINFFK